MTPEPNRSRDRIDELVNAELDGVITPAESAELAALLAENPEARQSRDQLRKLAGVLAQVEALEPPEALQRDLLAALPIRRVSTGQPGFLSLLRETWTRRRVLAYGYGLAAILLLALVGKEFISPVTTVGEKDGLTGTMAPKDPRPTADKPSFPNAINFDQPGLAGSIRLVRRTAGVFVEIDATSESPVVLEMRYDPHLITFEGDLLTDGDKVAWTGIAPGEVSFGSEDTTGLRRHAYRIPLSETSGNGPTTVHFQLVGSGDTVFEGALALEAALGDPVPEGGQ